jgi:hypothetical protein
MTMTPDPAVEWDEGVALRHERGWRYLTGRLAEWSELLETVAQRRGLTVIVSDPWSGTSGLLEQLPTLDELDERPVLVDARRCRDVADLAVAIADGAVGRWAPQALSSWTGESDPYGEHGLRLSQTLRRAGVDAAALQDAGRDPALRLRAALDLFVALGAASPAPTLCIDHLGRMLTGLRAAAARGILEALRAVRQARPQLNLLLADYTGGPIADALHDARHPLYRAGGTLTIRRASADRIAGDLAITKPHVSVQPPILREAAQLVDGVPALTWQVTKLAYLAPEGDAALRARYGWHQLQLITEPVTRRQWDVLRQLHSAAQPAAAALALDRAPHSLPIARKSVRDALHALRGAGIAFQPEPRTWHLADPLLAAWIARNPPIRGWRG